MDLFDLEKYFASYVPVKALTNPLLKHAACAYAAKQLGQVKGQKAIVGGACSRQAHMELWPDADKLDWFWIGAKHYDKAISLLMEVLQQDRGTTPLKSPTTYSEPRGAEINRENGYGRVKRRRLSGGNPNSDELLAATAILCVYEFLDASGAAWSRHLSGTKSLLDIAEVGMISLKVPLNGTSLPSPQRALPSKARKAIFWNFARQDFLAACKLMQDLTSGVERSPLQSSMSARPVWIPKTYRCGKMLGCCWTKLALSDRAIPLTVVFSRGIA